MSRMLDELADHLRTHQERIVEEWDRGCKSDEALAVASTLTRAEFRNNIPAAIAGLCAVIRRGPDDGLIDFIREQVAKHGHHRWKQGFSLRQLIRDWGHLNRVLIITIQDFFRAQQGETADEQRCAMDRLAVFITEATSNSVRRFDDLRRSEAAALAHDLRDTKSRFEQITKARGDLLREAAHDIRGGLSAIAGASAVLKLGEPQSLSELLDVLDQGVNSVLEMLNSLLELSRLEAGAETLEMQTVDVAKLLMDLAAEWRPKATAKSLELTTSGPQEAIVRTDPSKVRRIAQNLLANALQYTTEGEVGLSWELGSLNWTLRVTDTGPGIQDVQGSAIAREMDHQDRDREHPMQAGPQAYSGEGIGLTIVKRLCDMFDASISLDSAAGRGTCFTIEIPLRVADES